MHNFICEIKVVVFFVENLIFGGLLDTLRPKYLQRDKVSVYSIVSSGTTFDGYIWKKCFVIMVLFLPDAKNFRQGSRKFYICRSNTL
jgi:hypothetical protein